MVNTPKTFNPRKISGKDYGLGVFDTRIEKCFFRESA
jgi:hypothetical protein